MKLKAYYSPESRQIRAETPRIDWEAVSPCCGDCGEDVCTQFNQWVKDNPEVAIALRSGLIKSVEVALPDQGE